jgi:predicted amidophosphoribosyltransferase
LHYSEQSLCQFCLASLPRIDTLSGTKLQRIAQTLPGPPVTFHAALFFEAPVQTLCHSLKYGQNPRLAQELGHNILGPLILQHTRSTPSAPLLLIPMPIHRIRRLKRGYNQSMELARGAAQYLSHNQIRATTAPLIEKIANRNTQVSVGALERWHNTRGAFAPRVARAGTKKLRVPEDAQLILIDDTVTTGSSMLEAATVLRRQYPDLPMQLFALALEI